MKKLFALFAACLIVASMMGQNAATAKVIGNFADYDYYYVVPTTGITSSSAVVGSSHGVYGGATKTVVPSDVISGYLMQNGYNTAYTISPEIADRTLAVTYGHTGRRQLGPFSYASGIIIQMRNAKTQDLVATFEAEGCGTDETEDIYKAIYKALNLFSYTVHPRLEITRTSIYWNNIVLEFTNKTPKEIWNVRLRLKYYLGDELVHEQNTVVRASIPSGESVTRYVDRDDHYRKYKYQVKVELVEFE